MQKRQPSRGRPAGTLTYEAELAAAFGSVVREMRKAQNMAQESLANLADVERSHMGKLERGQHTPTLPVIFKIANALGQTPGVLMDCTQKYLKKAASNVLPTAPATRCRMSRKAAKPDVDSSP